MVKNQYLIENKKPVELVQELKNYEVKTSKLSPAARAKVTRKWGGDYQSLRVTTNNPSYGPGIDGVDSPNMRKWCSHCIENKEVDSSTKYCPTCGNMFGTVAKKAEINTQIDQNRRQVAEKGGTYEYYEEEGTKADGTTYSRIGSKYTGPTK